MTGDLSTPFWTRTTLKWTLWVCCLWLIGLLVAWFAPIDVVERFSLANAYVKTISLVFPIQQYAQKSHYPQVAQLYNAIVWVAFPWLFALQWQYLKTRKRGLLIKPDAELRIRDRLFLVGFAAPFCAGLAYVALFHWIGNDTRLVSFASSRIQLGLLGLAIPWGAAIFSCWAIASIKKSILGKL